VALYADLRRDPLRLRRLGPVRGATGLQAAVPFSEAAMAEAEEEADAADGDGSGTK
jgi:hypothetical protein